MREGAITTFIGAVVIGAVLLFLGAVIGGTILYFIWPIAIPAMFPKVVEWGFLATRLTWCQEVLITWVFGILIKNTTTSK